MWRLSFLFLCSCSLFAKNVPLCGDGVADPGEICFQQNDLDADPAPAVLTSVDLNQDGLLDFVNTNATTLTAFTGDGKGGFTLALRLAFDTPPIGLTVQDLNGDTKLDIAVVRLGAAFNVDTGFAEIFLADANGAFAATPSQSITIGVNPQLILPGDFNRDGFVDLALTEFTSQDIRVLLNDGVGGFVAQAPIAANAVVSALAVGDLDNDGDSDLVAGDLLLQDGNTPNNQLSVVINNEAAGFLVQKVNTGIAPGGVELADLDADGDLDILSANLGSSNVAILTNEGGAFTAPAQLVEVGVGPQTVLARDIDNDQDLDLVVGENDFNQSKGTFRLLLNDDASFVDKGTIDLGGLTQPFGAGDYNGDELLDFVISDLNSNQYSILLSTH